MISRTVVVIATVVIGSAVETPFAFCLLSSSRGASTAVRESGRSVLCATRRSFVCEVTAAASLVFVPVARVDAALPAITLEEFELLLKTAAKSVRIVEFSGPKSESGLVRLVDGTAFTLSDLVESPTDPRSPLKLVATCRSYRVPTKFTGLERAISDIPQQRKRRVYMNQRVQDAARKEDAKKKRMQADELLRLKELYDMDEETRISSTN